MFINVKFKKSNYFRIMTQDLDHLGLRLNFEEANAEATIKYEDGSHLGSYFKDTASFCLFS